jgi:CubicO group peptidase (beta-lactamase class C family)
MNDSTSRVAAAVTASSFPLSPCKPAELGFHEPALDRLRKLIRSHIEAGRYPGAQIALARQGRLALFETFGRASVQPDVTARDDTLWLLFSNTKVITAVGIWVLVEDGLLRFSDRVSQHVPEFARHGKGEITLAQVLCHRGGFPSAGATFECWTDHAELRRQVCDRRSRGRVRRSGCERTSPPPE